LFVWRDRPDKIGGTVAILGEDDFPAKFRSHLDAMRLHLETVLREIDDGVRLETVDGGYRIKTTGTHYIDVMQMIFNWRITATPKDRPWMYDRGWCYQGTGITGFIPAALAAIAWDGSDDTEPPGYFKRVGT
jgi:hypothetical protein